MVQFNLLPDIKLQYIKTQRTKHLVTFVATLASIISIGLLLLALFFVYVVQKQIIRSVDNDIKARSNTLQQIEDVDKILTVQNQLNSLTSLHEGKPATARVFGYLQKLTPEQANLNKLQLDFTTGTIMVGGNAPSLDTIKLYADALKGAKYSIGKDGDVTNAFSEVVLNSFTRDEKGASFTISARYAPDLFDITKNVTLQVAGTNNNVFQQEGQ